MVQWLRICLAIRRTWVQSLAGELGPHLLQGISPQGRPESGCGNQRPCLPQLRPDTAKSVSLKKKKKKKLGFQGKQTDINRSTALWGPRGPGLYLEDGGIHFLVVVLLAGVFPGDPEHGLLVVLPDQPRVHGAVDLLNQPLPQPPAAVPVTHSWEKKTHPVKLTSTLSLFAALQVLNSQEPLSGKSGDLNTGVSSGKPRDPGTRATCNEKTTRLPPAPPTPAET